MYILITTAVAGIIFTIGVFLLDRFLSSKKGDSLGADVLVNEDEAGELGETLEKALSYTELMLPLDSALEKEAGIENLLEQLSAEREKLKALDKQVEDLQSSVEVEEATHNELKKGKEEAVSLAHSIAARKDELRAEFDRLESELEQSLSQLSALASEVTLTADQQIAMNKISSALERGRAQLNTLNEIYTQAETRFLNLETQYTELEKEFTKLVEKELSAEA